MITFIVNPAGGRGRGDSIWPPLQRELAMQDREFRVWYTHGPGEATTLASEACSQAHGLEKLVVVGGDGTVNEVLNGIADFESVALGIVPIGSGNDFARGLGLPRDPRVALARILAASGATRIDLGELSVPGQVPRRFGISAGIGMDAWVCAQVDASRVKAGLNRFGLGGLTYGLMTLAAAAKPETANGTVRLFTPHREQERDLREMLFLACMNFPWEGGGVPIAPGASARDGFFSVCLAENLSRTQILRKLPLLALGRHTQTQGVTFLKASRVEVQLDAPLYLHADGEVPGRVKTAVFEILPQKLRVLI